MEMDEMGKERTKLISLSRKDTSAKSKQFKLRKGLSEVRGKKDRKK